MEKWMTHQDFQFINVLPHFSLFISSLLSSIFSLYSLVTPIQIALPKTPSIPLHLFDLSYLAKPQDWMRPTTCSLISCQGYTQQPQNCPAVFPHGSVILSPQHTSSMLSNTLPPPSATCRLSCFPWSGLLLSITYL